MIREFINIVEGLRITDDWFKDGSFEAFKIPDKREPFEVATDNGVINTLENPVPYKKGDYIMTGPDDEQYPIGPETFNKLKSDNVGAPFLSPSNKVVIPSKCFAISLFSTYRL